MSEGGVRILGFSSAILVFIVGCLHAVDSFAGTKASLRWQGPGLNVNEHINLGYQEVFLLTPYQLAKHWQPLILSYAVLGQHVAVLHTVTLYSNWWKAGIVYTLLALFGAFGFAGDMGLVAGALCLLTAFLSFCLAIFEKGPAAADLTEPLFPQQPQYHAADHTQYGRQAENEARPVAPATLASSA